MERGRGPIHVCKLSLIMWKARGIWDMLPQGNVYDEIIPNVFESLQRGCYAEISRNI